LLKVKINIKRGAYNEDLPLTLTNSDLTVFNNALTSLNSCSHAQGEESSSYLFIKDALQIGVPVGSNSFWELRTCLILKLTGEKFLEKCCQAQGCDQVLCGAG
jgi:hypothetical protein